MIRVFPHRIACASGEGALRGSADTTLESGEGRDATASMIRSTDVRSRGRIPLRLKQ